MGEERGTLKPSSSLSSSSQCDTSNTWVEKKDTNVPLYKEGDYEVLNGDKVFIATNEWQIVPDGVSIPPGLWVRMDISNGGRLARLLENETERKEEKGLIVTENDANDAPANKEKIISEKENGSGV